MNFARMQTRISNFLMVLVTLFFVQFTLVGQSKTVDVKVPLKELMNSAEGHFFNPIKIYLDEYRSKGYGGNRGWIQFGNGKKEYMDRIGTLFQTGAQRWHLNNMMSTGIDLRPDPNGDPTKWIVSVEFEEDEREIICITRISKKQDQASSGHIRNPQADIYIQLINSGSSVSFKVNQIKIRGRVDINVYGKLIDEAITKRVRPIVQKEIMKSLMYIKGKFADYLKNAKLKTNQTMRKYLSKYNIDSPEITRLRISGSHLVVSVKVPTSYLALWKKAKGAHALYRFSSWDGLMDKWRAMNKQGKRLHDIEAIVSDGTRRYVGVWREGKDGGAIYHYNNWDSFVKKWKELNKKKQYLADLETYSYQGKRWYIGVWRKGTKAGPLYRYNNFTDFAKKWKELAGKDRKLSDVEIFKYGDKTWYIGVWEKSSTPSALYKFSSWKSLAEKNKELKKKKLQLIDIESIKTSSGKQYVGVWRRSEASHTITRINGWSDFTKKWKEISGKGKRLVALQPY